MQNQTFVFDEQTTVQETSKEINQTDIESVINANWDVATQLTNQKIVEILTNQKPTRTDLSRIYKQLKPLGVQWMDILRKTSRPIVIKKLNEKKGKSKSIVKFTIYTKIDVNKINGHKQKRTLNFKDKKYTQFGKMLTLTTNSTFISNNFNKGKGKANVINRDDERWKTTKECQLAVQ